MIFFVLNNQPSRARRGHHALIVMLLALRVFIVVLGNLPERELLIWGSMSTFLEGCLPQL